MPLQSSDFCDLANQLIAILKHEIVLHATMVNTGGALNKALRASNVLLVGSLSNQFDATMVQIERLEEERLALCQSMCVQAKIPRYRNLDDIIPILDTSLAATLTKVRMDLKKLISELSIISASNKVLLEASLTVVAQTLGIRTRREVSPDVYRREGGTDSRLAVRTTLFNQVA